MNRLYLFSLYARDYFLDKNIDIPIWYNIYNVYTHTIAGGLSTTQL